MKEIETTFKRDSNLWRDFDETSYTIRVSEVVVGLMRVWPDMDDVDSAPIPKAEGKVYKKGYYAAKGKPTVWWVEGPKGFYAPRPETTEAPDASGEDAEALKDEEWEWKYRHSDRPSYAESQDPRIADVFKRLDGETL